MGLSRASETELDWISEFAHTSEPTGKVLLYVCLGNIQSNCIVLVATVHQRYNSYTEQSANAYGKLRSELEYRI